MPDPSATFGTGAALPLATRTTQLRSSAIGTVLRLAEAPGIISLAAGSPAHELFPAAAVEEVSSRLLREHADILQYGDTAGLPQLREWIATHVGARLSALPRPEHTILAHGSQQALDLVCKALLNPGDTVVVDRPSYVGALQVFRLFEAELASVPLAFDPELAALADALEQGLRPRLVYTVPDFANPTGARLTLVQRRRLADLADRYGFVIVEDDPYGELRYDTEGTTAPLPSIASLSDRVIRLGSFSKVLFPAARLGYLTAPAQLAPVLGLLKQASDLGNSGFIERIVLELVTRPGFVEDQSAAARTLYVARRDALALALRREFGDRLQFEVPEGGFFIWARFADRTHAADLLADALRHRVSYVPGAEFYAADPDQATLRLSFSGCSTGDLTRAAGRLHTTWSAAADRSPASSTPGSGAAR
ncbi:MULTISPECIES: PLP-dependent aminotransferase family protein [Streptomyces]|uniref:aminotransferase-like domain-containing protein n=1 Tax=Streptomyces TaxID=1883 RepID=UPI001B325C1A|nr:PLP-dependent aminotransferase family protein [Streptomyces sp. AgN23]QTI90606.1 PLP-dependent aminotransferase family protein [Streptomyces sp. AgN23]WTA78570.1 PLP-dependent aminotransferase family protein [Streptomyces antimycoticus]WTA86830.1 PLP-dependent aminotransferase family protein [Streptomyces antimycoticus]